MFDFTALTIVSGGQTGADRAALDAALDRGIAHSGWCPRGRLAEDGSIPERYKLRETPSRRYAQRTEWNVRDSDATVVFTIAAAVTGGTSLTLALARKLGKPSLRLSRDALVEEHGESAFVSAGTELLSTFLREHDVRVLNVAGPRGSQEPEIGEFVCGVMKKIFEA